MKKKLLAGLVIGLLLACFAANVSAVPTANYDVQGTYNDDYDIWIGVGDILLPDWIAQVAWTANGNGFETSGSITLPDALVWDNTWWLHADDNWGWYVGSIVGFSIDTDYGTYVSPDVPVYIPDQLDRYAYIDMPSNPAGAPVPEPSTILLVGTGLLGIIGFGRKRLNKKA